MLQTKKKNQIYPASRCVSEVIFIWKIPDNLATIIDKYLIF